MTQFSPAVLVRWTAVVMAIATFLFALAVYVERSGEAREGLVSGAHTEAGKEGATASSGEALGQSEQAEAATAEKGEAREIGEGEQIFGIDLENPWLLWGFGGLSFLLAAAALQFGLPALLLIILVAGGAAIFDVREVFFQLGRANVQISGLAALVAIAHAAAAILAVMAWRALRAGPVAPKER